MQKYLTVHWLDSALQVKAPLNWHLLDVDLIVHLLSIPGPFPMLMQGSGNVLNLNVQPSGVGKFSITMT